MQTDNKASNDKIYLEDKIKYLMWRQDNKMEGHNKEVGKYLINDFLFFWQFVFATIYFIKSRALTGNFSLKRGKEKLFVTENYWIIVQ